MLIYQTIDNQCEIFCEQEVANGGENKKINNEIEGKGVLRTSPPLPLSQIMIISICLPKTY